MVSVHETTMPPSPPADIAMKQSLAIPLFIALTAAGLAGNYFKFPIFLNIDFLFGSVFAMLALQMLGLGRGILAAALIASYSYLLWNHPYAIIIMTAEVAVVGWLMRRRRMELVLADTLYWLIIGMPLVYLFYHVVMQVPYSNTLITLTKQAVNGIANALAARLIFTLYILRSRRSLISYHEILTNLLAFFVLCPALIILGVGSRTDFTNIDHQIRAQLKQDRKGVADSVETWVVNRKFAILNLAEMAASRSPQQMQPFLEQAKKADPNFKRIGLLDRTATSVAFFPLLDELGRKNIGKNWADRPYIPTLQRTLKPMLSEVVMGRIGIPRPVVAMLAPVVIEGEYAGYVAGILSLEQIREHLDKSTEENATLYTLLDKQGHVIMTNRPDQKEMTPFDRGKGALRRLDDSGISQWVPVVPPNTPISERWKKSSYCAEATIGDLAEWKLVLEQPVAPFQKRLYSNYAGKLTLLFFILLGGLVLAELLSRKTVGTLEQLRLITRDLPARLEADGKAIAWPESGIEEAHHLIGNFSEMADSLSALFIEIRRVNESLEQRVAERTQQVARLSNEQRAILSTMPIGACLLRERVVELANPAFDTILGYDVGETLGMHASVFFPDSETYERLAAAGYGEIAKGAIYTVDTELRRKDGSRSWCSIAGQAVDEERPENGAIWMIQDIADRKQAEDALRSASVYTRTLIEASPDPLVTISAEGKITDVNEASVRATGIPREQLIGTDFSSYFTDPGKARLGYRLVFVDGVVHDYPLAIRHVSGSITDVLYNASVYRDEHGEVMGVFAAARDVTERKKAEEKIRKLNEELEIRVLERTAELERMNRELEEFCYAISHEFRAPIARLEGFGSMLLEMADAEGEEPIRHCARRIVAAGNRLRLVIDSLLSVNRLSRVGMQLTPVDLSEMCGQILAELLEQAGDRIIHVTIAPDVVVQGDHDMLEICMRNLLGNAVKYTAKAVEASIEFGKSFADGEYAYYVWDNGIGFDMEYAKHLFDQFRCYHNEPEFEGAGVGLATVQRIIGRHHGRIWAESVPGNGATFFFTLGGR